MENGNDQLLKSLENNSPVLFLGAGFSLGARGKNGRRLMLGGDLAKELYQHIIWANKENLSEKDLDKAAVAEKWGDLQGICNIIRENDLLEERNSFFQEFMSECTFEDAPYYSSLLNIDWKYIFTLNIDDLVEHIYQKAEKSLICWKNTSDRYTDDNDKTVLVKLHGDVGDPDTYVFDRKEYRNFSSQDNWMLRKFADLYVSHDIIVLGTQFQEDDIEIALDKVFEFGCDNSNFRYFFVSPGEYGGKIAEKINTKKNFFHIQMDTEEFLVFLEEKVSQQRNAIQELCAQSICYWNEELTKAQRRKEIPDLYYGKPSDPADFYYSVDIPRTRELQKIEDFLNDNSYGFIEIKGMPYIGKTCLAKRTLTKGVEQTFKSFYCIKTDLQDIQTVNHYLMSASEEDSILICFEDAADFYRPIVNMAEQYREKISKLIIILISGDTTRRSNNYVFGKNPLCEIRLNEKVSNVVAEDIYDKLEEKSQLGKLLNYAERKKHTLKFMREINDFIDVLYVAHHGKRFAEYFESWIDVRKDDAQYPVFQAITLLTALGIPSVSLVYLPDISESLKCPKFDYQKFLQNFGEFYVVEYDSLRLRCSRLFMDVILSTLTSAQKMQLIGDLAYTLSKDLTEQDRTFNNEVFQHLIRASSLKQIVGLSDNDAKGLLISLQEFCGHISYYWIQLGILYRNVDQYEEAENAFEYAKKAHGIENYQIAHSIAKNYMEWGLWSVDTAPSQASTLFEEGATKMLGLIWRWKAPDAVCFSAHAYIDMNIKYYNKLKRTPSDGTWQAMNTCMEKYILNTTPTDRLLHGIFNSMCRFAEKYKIPFERKHEFQKYMEGQTGSTSYRAEVLEEYELPQYD